jgi:hypothetical protein
MNTSPKLGAPKMSKFETALIISIYGIGFIGFCVAAVAFIVHLIS